MCAPQANKQTNTFGNFSVTIRTRAKENILSLDKILNRPKFKKKKNKHPNPKQYKVKTTGKKEFPSYKQFEIKNFRIIIVTLP